MKMYENYVENLIYFTNIIDLIKVECRNKEIIRTCVSVAIIF